jgi:hypothetical protein
MGLKVRADVDNYPATFGVETKRYKEIWNGICKVIGDGGPHERQKGVIEYIEALPTDEEKLIATFAFGTMLGEERGFMTVKNDVAKKIISLAIDIAKGSKDDASIKLMALAMGLASSGSGVRPVGDDEDEKEENEDDKKGMACEIVVKDDEKKEKDDKAKKKIDDWRNIYR